MSRRLAVAVLCLAAVVTGGAGAHAMAAHGATSTRSTAPARRAHVSTSARFALLQVGSTGARVRAIQARLTAKGYRVAVDGRYGPRTRDAVRRFQLAHHLIADGRVGAATWHALGLDAAASVPKPTGVTTTTPALPPLPAGTYHFANANVERWHAWALATGWADSQWPTLSCIINRESHGNPNATNSSGATGLLQIVYSAHAALVGGPRSALLAPRTNLHVGHLIYLRSGWSPWASSSSPC